MVQFGVAVGPCALRLLVRRGRALGEMEMQRRGASTPLDPLLSGSVRRGSRMAERRGLKSSPTRASSQRLSSQQVGEAEAGKQEERSPLHQFEPDVSVPSAPPGMSGLPASVSLHKVWSYSDPSRKPPPMAFMDAKGKIRRVGSHESISKSSS